MPDYEYRNPYEHRKPKKERNGNATAALIFCILSLINLCCFSFTTAIVLGVGAVSFGLLSKKEQKLTTPTKIAIFVGVGSIVFGLIEYFLVLKLYDFIKMPENIGQFNQLYEEAEKLLESQAALRESFKH